jgi:phage nucleotide-binding protein
MTSDASTTSTEKTRTLAGLRLRRVTDLIDRGLCFIIYGQAGAGKTPTAAEAVFSPFASPMLDIDIENGTMSIRHLGSRDDFDVVRPIRYQKVEEIIDKLKQEKGAGYKAVMLDNASELHLMIQRSVAGQTDQPTQPEWGEINRIFLNIIEKMRDLAASTEMVVFILCWDVDDKQENGKVKKQLMFTPQVQNLLPGKVDVIGHISVNTDQSRLLSFKQGPLTVAKFRRSLESNEAKIPLDIQFERKHHPFVDILNVLKGGGNWPANDYPRMQQQQRAPQRAAQEGTTGNQGENTPEDN